MSGRASTYFALGLLCLLQCVACLAPLPARGAEEDTLGLYSDWQEQSASAGRAPKPLSHTAENVTVITSRQVAALNAHTLADVLATVPGLQLDNRGGPASSSLTLIQSSKFNHVLVLVDGIPLNNLGDNYPDVALIPARVIERIEIVKGAASAAWGQALGGVINVITKGPEPERSAGVGFDTSLGSRTTTDSGVELSGTRSRLGYYLSGGYLGSNGLTPGTQFYGNNAYGRLLYDLPDRGQLGLTLNYTQAQRGEFASTLYGFRAEDRDHLLNAAITYRRPLDGQTELELLLRHTNRNTDISASLLNGFPLMRVNGREQASGGGLKLVRRAASNLLVGGLEFEHAELNNSDSLLLVDTLRRNVDRWGAYLNDTITLGPVSVSPGGRYDHTQSGGDQFSPTLGFTWQLSEATLVRGYSAKGFSLPALTLNRSAEKVWTTQVGLESTAIPYLWLKGTLFRNESWDVLQRNPATGAWVPERHFALGYELEGRTTPVYDTSLEAGYTFTDTTRSGDSHQVKGAPRHTVQLGVRYDDLKRYRALLTARHIFWNEPPNDLGRYHGLVWDLHLGATLYRRGQTSVELFGSGHNLFNTDQYTLDAYPNPARWFEGGLKVRF